MAWSSSQVSCRMARLGCADERMWFSLQSVLPRSLVGWEPDLNGSGRLGGARQADMTGGGVLSRKNSKT